MSTVPDTAAAAGPPAPLAPLAQPASHAADAAAAADAGPRLPRVTIQFCTQCKWMLRAAYFAQELLSTFGPALGEVALQPATGGVFTVAIEAGAAAKLLLWDRKSEGGFPETKELKRRVRDVIAPGRDLGHVDRHDKDKAADAAPAADTAPATATTAPETTAAPQATATGPVCEDCQ